jgi:hypothetical protein
MLRQRSLPETDRQWLKVLGTLNEFQARLFVAARALQMGRGGVSRMCRLTGMSRTTIGGGIAELTKRGRPAAPAEGKQRTPGAGRQRAEQLEPGLLGALTRLVEDSTAGDPMSPLIYYLRNSSRAATIFGGGLPSLLGLRAKPALGIRVPTSLLPARGTAGSTSS